MSFFVDEREANRAEYGRVFNFARVLLSMKLEPHEVFEKIAERNRDGTIDERSAVTYRRAVLDATLGSEPCLEV